MVASSGLGGHRGQWVEQGSRTSACKTGSRALGIGAHGQLSLFWEPQKLQRYEPKGYREESLWLRIVQSTLGHHVWYYALLRGNYSLGTVNIYVASVMAGTLTLGWPTCPSLQGTDCLGFSPEKPSSRENPLPWADRLARHPHWLH